MKKNSATEKDKTPSNVIAFKRDVDVIDEIAEDLLDENDRVSALALLREIEARGDGDFHTYQRIADLYTELFMFERSIDYWYKFLDSAPAKYRAEAYNGLGGNYYFLKKEKIAAYYFNLQISDKGDADFPFDELMYELFAPNSEDEPLKVVDAQSITDEKTIKRAREYMEGDFIRALKECSKIGEGSPYYGEAQFLEGTFLLAYLDFDNALTCFIHARDEDYRKDVVQTEIFSLSLMLGNRVLADKTFEELKREGNIAQECTLKYFSLFSAYDHFDLAYEYYQKLAKLLPDYGDLILFGGYAAFNAGKYDDAAKNFHDYYKITGEAYALNYAELAHEQAVKKKKPTKPYLLDYRFGYERSYMLQIADEMMGYYGKRLISSDGFDEVKYCADVCLTSDDPELLAATFQTLCNYDSAYAAKKMKEYLLKASGVESIKLLAISLLSEHGQEKPVGVVIGDLYSRVPFERVEFNEECGDVFRSAYSVAFGRIAPYCEKEAYKLRVAAYALYDRFLSNGNVRKVKSPNALAALIFKRSGIKLFGEDKDFCKYFGTTVAALGRLEGLAEEE